MRRVAAWLALLLCAGAADAQQVPAPRMSLVVGTLRGGTTVGEIPGCGERPDEICVGTLVKAQVRRIRTLSGARIASNAPILLTMASAFAKPRRVMLMVSRLENGALYAENWEIVADGKACFHPSWFDRDKLGPVRGRWKDEDGNICIRA
jgi:hypothetical protein